MQMERSKNAIRNMIWGYLYKIISIVLPFVLRTEMIHLLGAEYLGINSLFTSILQMLSLSELGFGTAIVYSMYKPIAEGDKDTICALLNFYKKIYFLIGCGILGVGLFLTPFIPLFISGEYPYNINIYFVYIMFLLNTSMSYFLFAYRGSLLNAFQRNDVESKISCIVCLFRYIAEIIGLWITKQYYLFLFVELVATIVTNILKLIVTNKMYPDLKSKGNVSIGQKKTIKKHVFALSCHKIGGIVLNSADNIVLSAFMGVVIVANYNNYYYIMSAVTALLLICFDGITAGIGNSFVVESREKNKQYFKKVLFFNAWAVCICSVCLMCLYQDFIEFWVGKEYLLSNDIVVLMVLYFYVHCIRRTIITFRDGAGMWMDNMWQPIISALFNIIVNILLVNVIGLAGIIISSILSMVIIDIPWETNSFCEKIDMKNKEYLLLLLNHFVITILVTTVIYLMCNLIHLPLLISLIVKFIVCVLASNLAFYLLFGNSNEYKYFLQLFQRYFLKRKEKW